MQPRKFIAAWVGTTANAHALMPSSQLGQLVVQCALKKTVLRAV